MIDHKPLRLPSPDWGPIQLHLIGEQKTSQSFHSFGLFVAAPSEFGECFGIFTHHLNVCESRVVSPIAKLQRALFSDICRLRRSFRKEVNGDIYSNCGTRSGSRLHFLPLISHTSGSRSGRSSSRTGRSWVSPVCIHLNRRRRQNGN